MKENHKLVYNDTDEKIATHVLNLWDWDRLKSDK